VCNKGRCSFVVEPHWLWLNSSLLRKGRGAISCSMAMPAKKENFFASEVWQVSWAQYCDGLGGEGVSCVELSLEFLYGRKNIIYEHLTFKWYLTGEKK